jgi:hypothetical protein
MTKSKIAHHQMMAKLALLRAKKAASNTEAARQLNLHSMHMRAISNLIHQG